MAEITPDDFLDRVAAGKIPPVVFLYGEEDYKTEECVNAAIAKTLDESSKGFNLDVLYGSKAAAKDVLAIATSFPMMSERRVVVVKEFERLVIGDSARTLVMSYVDRPLESTVLLLAADDPDLRKKPFAELKKKIDAVYCKPLWENQIPPWVFSYVKKHKRNIDDGACHMLAAYVGTSLRALSNEIEKLFIFLGDRTDITVDDVTSVVGATKGFTVFDLQRAVGKKNVKEATTIAQRMMTMGESPQMIIAMLTRYFIQLVRAAELRRRRASEHEVASALRISPYFVKNIIEASGNFSSSHIDHCFAALRDADVELKSSGREPALVLDLLIYSLVRGDVVRPTDYFLV